MRVPWLADVLRGAGLDVYELPGWYGRGKELAPPQGVIWHHTATSTRWADGHVAALLRDGRRDLAGPLAQLGLERDGTFVTIADGRANHNGYGTWGNASIGIEAYNDGVGEPWPDVQVDAYVRGTRAILGHMGLPASRTLGHKESDPRRKIDPAGLDMDEMRRRIATDEGDAVTPEQMATLGRWMQEQANRTIAEIGERVDAQTDQIDRFSVWQMRQAGVSDADIRRILGKDKLPPA